MKDSNHWYYFLQIEEDFSKLCRYIEPTGSNFNTYSFEIARLLMTTVQECDVIFKKLCRIKGKNDYKSEKEYREFLSVHIPKMMSQCVNINRASIMTEPFDSWKKNQTPEWWTANNKIKHDRGNNFEYAKLGNLIGAISALLILNMYISRDENNHVFMIPGSEEFRIVANAVGTIQKTIIKYELPD